MNESTPTVPSLLSLTAPTGRERKGSAATEGFADELSAASSAGAKPSHEPPATPSESVTSESVEKPSKASRDEGVEDPPEASDVALLSVTVATETLVVETSPNAVLPEEAVTTIDVGANEAPLLLGDLETVGSDAGLRNSSELTEESADEGVQLPVLPQSVPSPSAQDASKKSADAAIQSAGTNAVLEEKTDGEEESSNPKASTSDDALLLDEEQQPVETVSTPSAADRSANPLDAPPADQGEASTAGDAPEPIEPKPSANEPSLKIAPETTASNDSAGREPTVASGGPTGEASRVEQAQSVETRPTVDATRFVSRVAGAVNSANERGGPIEIRLSPPELGALRVSIEVKEGILTAQLEAETPAARATLLDNLPALRDRLEQQQIRIDKFDVDVRDESGQRGGDWQPNDNREQRPDERADHREPRPKPSAPQERSEPTPDSTAPRTIVFDNNGINLVA